MKGYILARLVSQSATLLGVIVVVFIFTRFIGDPVKLMAPDAPLAVIDAIKAKYGLDLPPHVQFVSYLRGLLRFDFGTSITSGVPNIELIMSRLPATLQLAVVATTFAAIVGLLLGVLAALKPGSPVDRLVMLFTTFLVTSLDFWIALLLIFAVSVELRLLPTSGYGDLRHMVLPALVISLRPMGRIAQVTRPAVMNELAKPYIVALRARGLPEYKITLHAARNAGILVLTLVGYEFASLLNGSAIIETVFAWPGLGFLLIGAIRDADWLLITGITIFVAAMVLTLNLLIDVAYAWLDPRVQYG